MPDPRSPGGIHADQALALLILAVLYQIPVFLAAMACTWLAHEWALHRGSRLSWRSIATRAFWTRTLWDHPGHFLITYLILFIGFLTLFQLPFWYATNARTENLPTGLLGLAPALGYVLAWLVVGALALRTRLRSHMA